MAITDYKITEEEKNERLVGSVPGADLTGTVQENKDIFDRLGKLLVERINKIIDETGATDTAFIEKLKGVEKSIKDNKIKAFEMIDLGKIKITLGNDSFFQILLEPSKIVADSKGKTLSALNEEVVNGNINLQLLQEQFDAYVDKTKGIETVLELFKDVKVDVASVVLKTAKVDCNVSSNSPLNLIKHFVYNVPSLLYGENVSFVKGAGKKVVSSDNGIALNGVFMMGDGTIYEDVLKGVLCGGFGVFPTSKINLTSDNGVTVTDVGGEYKLTSNNEVFKEIIKNEIPLVVGVYRKKYQSVTFGDLSLDEINTTLGYQKVSDTEMIVFVDIAGTETIGQTTSDDCYLVGFYPSNSHTFNANVGNIYSFGDGNVISKQNNFIIGNSCHAFNHSHNWQLGEDLTSFENFCMTIGKYNNYSTGNKFVIGNGNYSDKRNIFRVTNNGATYALEAYNSTGADYAEYFEWEDGNKDSEDRVGKFVTLVGEKIKLAKDGDDVIGITSANPSVIGDSYDDDWHNKYLTDEWHRVIYEKKIIPKKKDEEGNIIQEEVIEEVPKLNPNYNDNMMYIPRKDRKEWSAVGLMGKLLVSDDGTAKVGDYIKPKANGIATKSGEKTRFKVMKRISEDIVKVIML